MSWTNYFDRIVVFNLRKRQDRLLSIVEEMDKMDIPFELVTAIEHENGAEGLKLTLEKTLKESIERKHKNILIFEDDCIFIEDKQMVDYTMTKALEQLPNYWDLLYLSAQVTNGFIRRVGSNLLELNSAFATHSWALSERGMKSVLSNGLYAPIDNYVVKEVQPIGGTFIVQPILTTQKAGISDIGMCEINWDAFITHRYNQKIAESGL